VRTNQVASHFAHGDYLGICTSKTGSEPETVYYESYVNVSPNPVTEIAGIRFSVAESEVVKVELWSVTGQKLKVIYTGNVTAGEEISATADAGNMENGLYFIRMVSASGEQVTARMIVTH
jgi:hypothetical protein